MTVSIMYVPGSSKYLKEVQNGNILNIQQKTGYVKTINPCNVILCSYKNIIRYLLTRMWA